MTHTDTIRESAHPLEQAARCVAALAHAIDEATDEECRQKIAEAIRHALSDVARAGAVFQSTANAYAFSLPRT